ncbi:hypothetical protein GCM10023116_24600 [Kistimonas scapharcae]|uniref:Co-chaperone DjlA N-terminal domain-containing protein n=1 Tax=Kistimonas scapharcae TaxID=1036133 RepID=A0ABP8V5I3_9GAMM
MDILELIHEATKEANSFANHPAKALPLEERLLYLNGLSLVMNADADIDEGEKEYIRILVKSFDLDESCLNDVVGFGQAPDKDTIQAFFRTFRRKPLAQLFLFDAYMMGMRDGLLQDKERAVIDKIAEQLEVLKGTQRDIFDLFCHIKNKNWTESSLYFSSHLLNPRHFQHLLEYYEVDLDDLLKKTEKLRQDRLKERLYSDLNMEWIPLTYTNTDCLPEQTEITKDFVGFTATYGIILPYVQSMLDRDELRVNNNNVYKKSAIGRSDTGTANEVYIDLSESDIRFDPVSQSFSVAPEKSDELADLPAKVFVDFFVFCNPICPNSIGYGKRFKELQDDFVCFPMASDVNDDEFKCIESECLRGVSAPI